MSTLHGSSLRLLPIALLSIAIASAVAAPALAQTEVQRSGFIQLFVWHDGEVPELRPIHNLLGLYHQVHPESPKIVLNVHPTSKAHQRLEAWSGPERATTPDMVVLPSAWLREFGHMLRSLQAALSAERRAGFYPPVLAMFTVDGRLRAVPWLIGARGLLVRADLLQEAGQAAPQTWDEVLEVARALHNPPVVYGIGLPGAAGAGELLTEMTWAHGGALYDDEGHLRLDSAAMVAALECFGRLAQVAPPQALTWTQPELEGLFAQGKLAMLLTDSWWVQQVTQDQEFDWQVQMLGLPRQSQPTAHLIGEGLAIFRDTPHERECLEFARMIAQQQCQAQLLNLGGLPTGPGLVAACRDDPLRAALALSLDQARDVPTADREKVYSALSLAVYLSLSGRMAPAEAVQHAQDVLLASP